MARGLAAYLHGRGGWSLYVRPLAGGGLERALRSWAGDGVIFSAGRVPDIEFARSLGVPVVNVVGSLGDTGLVSVIGDDAAVGRRAAEHVLDRGFRHFMTVGGGASHFARIRLSSFAARVAEAGGEVLERVGEPELFALPWAGQLETLTPRLRALPRPAAVFAVFDALAHVVMEAARQAGLAVPADLAVLGVDNDPVFTILSDPPLSSVSQDFERRGYEAAALLDRLMAGEPPPAEPIRIPPDAVIARGSTDTFAVEDEHIRAALRYIADNTADTLGVDDVAAAVHMSRRNLERRFKLALGRTVYDEVRRVRLEAAKAALAATDRPILEIALDAGFLSSSDLANAFRRHVGMTPTGYRKRFGRR